MTEIYGANVPVSKVQLRIKLNNLVDKDTFSKSDPQVTVYCRQSTKAQWLEAGKTEVIMNNLNPEFAKPIEIDYFFEEEQQLKFVVYDIDDFKNPNSTKNDFLGEYTTTLANIVNARNKRIKGRLLKIQHGDIIITAEEISDSKKVVTYKFSAKKLDKKDFFGKSDPFFAVYRRVNNGNIGDNLLLTYESEVIKNNLNPSWKKGEVKLAKISNSNIDEPLVIKIFDWNRNGDRDYIGEFETSIAELSAFKNKEYDIINVKKKAKKGKSYKNSGIFISEYCEVREEYSFLDYLAGKTNFNLTIAVDFTASNKEPSNPSSLHYRNPSAYNEYQQAIYSVSRILEVYSKDKQFPVYGFGAKVNSRVSHCFPLNGNEMQPKVFGIEGIMNSYANTLRNIVLYGPTNFSPVINKVIAECEQMQNNEGKGNNYHVLLIITDGKISDREETIRSIVKASFLPISIIIVGVGNDDFETMNELDADEVPLRDGNIVMNRDIVQFVPYRAVNAANDPKVLAKQVLYEIPEQFILYMKQNNIKPKQLNAESSFISEYTPAFERQSSFIAGKENSFVLDPNASFASTGQTNRVSNSIYSHATTNNYTPYQYTYPPQQYQTISQTMSPTISPQPTSASPNIAPTNSVQQGSVYIPAGTVQQQGSVYAPAGTVQQQGSVYAPAGTVQQQGSVYAPAGTVQQQGSVYAPAGTVPQGSVYAPQGAQYPYGYVYVQQPYGYPQTQNGSFSSAAPPNYAYVYPAQPGQAQPGQSNQSS
ncbi:Copine-domain-containing protein [Piromyces finnis]|uniref:Copine-3 n=1 Tax=Piromyces finnis TaxID=1754191 RepID=A0A1Y1VKW3_9FUNG|nr:Copine-domain-containing protein [Piromyces finnis]|eukprot:ORX58526.1 Copine-domain-containing protein [Piromyces finnis]